MTIPQVLFAFFSVSTVAGAQEKEEAKPPGLFRQIGIDFKNVFTTKENVVTVGVGAGGAWGASFFDDDITQSTFGADNEGGADEVFDAGRVLGGAAVQVGGAIATYGLGKLFHHKGAEMLGRDLVRAQVVAQSFTFALKVTTQRERPDGSNNYSFPSGHASGSFATATVLQRRYGWKVGVPAYAVAGYAATSRLTEGKHHLSDVVFGAALGIMAGRTVTLELARARLAVSPTFPRDGVGIQFTWLGSSDDSLRSR
ncbi:MAG TPA: phosphatase PAP2 family protein [Vicinamibacteria bacterium]